MKGLAAAVALVVVGLPAAGAQAPTDEGYLRWTSAEVESIGGGTYRRGQVGKTLDLRLLKTERASNYKLAATWLTRDVIRASARLQQLRSRLTDEQTRQLVREAEAAGDIVIMVEIDPREGSGVIPRDWEAFLEPKGRPERGVRGVTNQALRDVRGLEGVKRRNYDYDRFWVVFDDEKEGRPIFDAGDASAELVVRIYDREGRVEWPLPSSLRR